MRLQCKHLGIYNSKRGFFVLKEQTSFAELAFLFLCKPNGRLCRQCMSAMGVSTGAGKFGRLMQFVAEKHPVKLYSRRQEDVLALRQSPDQMHHYTITSLETNLENLCHTCDVLPAIPSDNYPSS